MAEQQQHGQNQEARRAQDASRRGGDQRRGAPDEIAGVTGQLASLGAETFGTWTDLNQRVSGDLLRISSGLVEETVRATSEMQQAAFVAWRDTQATAFRWYTLWPEMFRDPVRWYQHAFDQAIGAMQDAVDLGRRNTETALRAFDRSHKHLEEAARTLEDTFRQSSTKIRDIQSRTETTRVA